MSYCRWSSLNGYCDVYVYESLDGWICHVAKNHPLPGAPPDPIEVIWANHWVPSIWTSKLYKMREDLKRAWREKVPYEDIDSEYAGASAGFETPGECADFLELLVSEGFMVPKDVIEILREEQEELDENQ